VYENDRGGPVPVLPGERALGDPIVRVEVDFDQRAGTSRGMIAVDEMPSVPRTPGARWARRTGVVSRGARVHLRTLRPDDLEYLSDWAEDSFLERMVGSEFLNTYKHVYDKDPSFYEACLMDSTQIVLVIEADPEWAGPIGIARLFNIHLQEGYAFLEVMLTDAKAIRRGFGVEAGKLISYYGVDVLGLRRIEAKVYEYNRLSANSLRRNGFRQEGVLRKAGYQDGQCWDMLVFGILEHEIEQQRKKDRIRLPLDGPGGDTRDAT
jgi:RimJ/RimL family protein N-acetyltransferase